MAFQNSPHKDSLEEALGKAYITLNPPLLPSDSMANGFHPHLRSVSQSFTHHGKASGRWLEYNGAGRTQWRTVTPQLESHSFSSIHQYARPGVSRPQDSVRAVLATQTAA